MAWPHDGGWSTYLVDPGTTFLSENLVLNNVKQFSTKEMSLTINQLTGFLFFLSPS